MHERPGPQYNRGSDPTTAIGKIKNATQKNDTKGFETFFLYSLLASSVSCCLQWRIQGRGRGGPVPPLVLDQKEARRAEKKFFWRPGPPLYLRIWMTAPQAITGSTPRLSDPNGAKSIPLPGVGEPKLAKSSQKEQAGSNKTHKMVVNWLGNHIGKKKHTREESRFLFKSFDTYNLGQSSWDINVTAGENDGFSLPPGSVLTLWLNIFFNTINIAEGRGDSRNRFFQQHFQAFITGKIRFQ